MKKLSAVLFGLIMIMNTFTVSYAADDVTFEPAFNPSYNFEVKRIIDGKFDTQTYAGCNPGSPYSFIIKASSPIVVTGYTIVTSKDTVKFKGLQNPECWTLYGCNSDEAPEKDSSKWVALDTVDDNPLPVSNCAQCKFEVEGNTTAYQYYMLSVTRNKAKQVPKNGFRMAELTLDYEGKSGGTDYNTNITNNSPQVVRCPVCNGNGKMVCASCAGSGTATGSSRICSGCGGSGYHVCTTCSGTGTVVK